jgi:hypothetical protein
VATRFAEARSAAQRLSAAEPALREAIDLVQKSTEGLGQTRRIGDALTLVVRPQEAVAAVQAFAQANTDFFAAVADYNRAQFRLYRALGHPAQCLAGINPQVPIEEPVPVPTPVPPAQPALTPDVSPVRADAPASRCEPPTPGARPQDAPQPLPVTEWKAISASEEKPSAPLRPPVVVPEPSD